jgi:hypothetical protein
MNAAPETLPSARPPSAPRTNICATTNSTRVDWLAKDLYRYLARPERREFLDHCRAAAVSGYMGRTRLVGSREAFRPSGRKVFSLIISIRAEYRRNFDEFLSAPALEAPGSSGTEVSGVYRDSGMVMAGNVNLTLDVVRGQRPAGIRPIEGSAACVSRGAPQ